MLTTAEALRTVLDSVARLPAETLSLGSAGARFLCQSVVAERDQPPFDRVMMDGIAIEHAQLAAGRRRFPVQAMQAAGDPRLELVTGAAIEIMTGAALPEGADCIVPVERLQVADGIATVADDYTAIPGQFVHRRGSDHRAGTELLRPGARIDAHATAVIASCGLDAVAVTRAATITVLSTGNELVPPGQPILEHQVRLSNGPALVAILADNGYSGAVHRHVPDDETQLATSIGQALDESDVLVLSGGVSMGQADFVPTVLERLGVRCLFHKVSQRPGKPLWFGTGPRGQVVFGLPGNPVSSLVCCRHYVVPALRRMSGAADAAPQFAALTAALSFAPALTQFVPVRLLSNAAAQLLALPVTTNTSGDFAALAGTDGYVELARDRTEFPAGTAVPLHRWRA